MGTRNLTVVVSGGEHKVAQYGQWDGYPSGQGITILYFLRDDDQEGLVERLKERLNDVKYADKAFLDAYNANAPEYHNDPDHRTEEQRLWFKTFGSRDIGGEILENIATTEGEVVLIDQYKFAGESLFCEWAYVVDFDKNTFEVYKGFNKEKLSEGDRFYNVATDEKAGDVFEGGNYQQVKIVKEYKLDSLPLKVHFLDDLEGSDDEDE